MIDWVALAIAAGLWICVGHQIASGDHWSVILCFGLLAIGNTFVAVKDARRAAR